MDFNLKFDINFKKSFSVDEDYFIVAGSGEPLGVDGDIFFGVDFNVEFEDGIDDH